MVDIQNLQRQHQEISKLIGQLAAYDRYAYPLLTAHSNTEIQAVSQKFADEMGNLSAVFLQFQEKYANAAKIRALAPSFVAELKGIVTAIQERIAREDKSLYPLLER